MPEHGKVSPPRLPWRAGRQRWFFSPRGCSVSLRKQKDGSRPQNNKVLPGGGGSEFAVLGVKPFLAVLC